MTLHANYSASFGSFPIPTVVNSASLSTGASGIGFTSMTSASADSGSISIEESESADKSDSDSPSVDCTCCFFGAAVRFFSGFSSLVVVIFSVVLHRFLPLISSSQPPVVLFLDISSDIFF